MAETPPISSVSVGAKRKTWTQIFQDTVCTVSYRVQPCGSVSSSAGSSYLSFSNRLALTTCCYRLSIQNFDGAPHALSNPWGYLDRYLPHVHRLLAPSDRCHLFPSHRCRRCLVRLFQRGRVFPSSFEDWQCYRCECGLKSIVGNLLIMSRV